MENNNITGKKIIEIYETNPIYGEDSLGLGAPTYFQIVLELEDKSKIELGLHEIKEWNSKETLMVSEGTSWAFENNLEYRNQTIKQIIKRDPNEYYDGSLTLILGNNVILEHQGCNGDQLFIGSITDIDQE